LSNNTILIPFGIELEKIVTSPELKSDFNNKELIFKSFTLDKNS